MSKVSYITTDYRTFLIGFRNATTKLIIQDRDSLEAARTQWGLMGGYELDSDSLRELNSYGRFVRVKNIPTWLHQTFVDETNRLKERIAVRDNEMGF